MQKKIYLYLCGGVGNQLFQYALGRNLAIENKAKLILDISTGFVSDFRWNNKFLLDKLQLKNCFFKKNIMIFFFYRIYNFFFKKTRNSFFFKNLLNESFINKFDDKILRSKFKKNLYLLGFFQSEKYFFQNKKTILKEITPKYSKNKIFIDMKNKMANCSSVAVGCRLYEDTSEEIVKKMGGVEKYSFYENSLIKMIKKIKNPIFFLFSTHSKNLINIVDYIKSKNCKFYIITPDYGFIDTIDNLWLLSFCQNHIISNSSFYWWGAYLSRLNYKKQLIICSKNFVNSDTCLAEWKKN
jgi:hypothetical protein